MTAPPPERPPDRTERRRPREGDPRAPGGSTGQTIDREHSATPAAGASRPEHRRVVAREVLAAERERRRQLSLGLDVQSSNAERVCDGAAPIASKVLTLEPVCDVTSLDLDLEREQPDDDDPPEAA